MDNKYQLLAPAFETFIGRKIQTVTVGDTGLFVETVNGDLFWGVLDAEGKLIFSKVEDEPD